MAANRDRHGLRERAHRLWADPAIAARFRVGQFKRELPAMDPDQRRTYRRLRRKLVPREEALKVLFHV
jgi:hypothetical protein